MMQCETWYCDRNRYRCDTRDCVDNKINHILMPQLPPYGVYFVAMSTSLLYQIVVVVVVVVVAVVVPTDDYNRARANDDRRHIDKIVLPRCIHYCPNPSPDRRLRNSVERRFRRVAAWVRNRLYHIVWWFFLDLMTAAVSFPFYHCCCCCCCDSSCSSSRKPSVSSTLLRTHP